MGLRNPSLKLPGMSDALTKFCLCVCFFLPTRAVGPENIVRYQVWWSWCIYAGTIHPIQHSVVRKCYRRASNSSQQGSPFSPAMGVCVSHPMLSLPSNPLRYSLLFFYCCIVYKKRLRRHEINQENKIHEINCTNSLISPLHSSFFLLVVPSAFC